MIQIQKNLKIVLVGLVFALSCKAPRSGESDEKEEIQATTLTPAESMSETEQWLRDAIALLPANIGAKKALESVYPTVKAEDPELKISSPVACEDAGAVSFTGAKAKCVSLDQVKLALDATEFFMDGPKRFLQLAHGSFNSDNLNFRAQEGAQEWLFKKDVTPENAMAAIRAGLVDTLNRSSKARVVMVPTVHPLKGDADLTPACFSLGLMVKQLDQSPKVVLDGLRQLDASQQVEPYLSNNAYFAAFLAFEADGPSINDVLHFDFVAAKFFSHFNSGAVLAMSPIMNAGASIDDASAGEFDYRCSVEGGDCRVALGEPVENSESCPLFRVISASDIK